MNGRIGAMLVGLSLGLGFVGCGKKAIPEVDLSTAEPRVVLLTEQHEVAEVRAAIISAMQDRGWAAEQEAGTDITARLSHKGVMVRVVIGYTNDRVSIRGLVAQGAGRNYEKWMANLEASLRDRLKKAAPGVAPMAPAAAPVGPTPAPTMAIFETKQQPQNVKGVLQRALAQHSWVIEQEEAGGALIARLNHRKGQVRVRIVADVGQATITYVDSQGVDIDATGRSAEYEKWMRNLVDAIRASTRT